MGRAAAAVPRGRAGDVKAGPDFDPERAPSAPRDAAAAILVRAREGDGAAEVYLVRRSARASFMAQAFVFPGGGREGDEDPRVTAARELFEEAGVLLADRPVAQDALARLRAREAAGEALPALLAEAGRGLDPGGLVPFGHWVTPSAERRRFSARFFLAVLPGGQVPSVDGRETVEGRWVTPADALARSDELLLPPPQLRTLWELRDAARGGPAAVLALAAAREVAPILPRFAPLPDAPGGFALLLPWDPEYLSLGTGEAVAPRRDAGPSRFVRVGEAWRMGGGDPGDRGAR